MVRYTRITRNHRLRKRHSRCNPSVAPTLKAPPPAPGAASQALSTNAVLRNTYWLLSLTLLFSALCAWVGMQMNFGGVGILGFFVGAYGLMFLTHKLRNSVWGLAAVFAFTGFFGFMTGAHAQHLPDGRTQRRPAGADGARRHRPDLPGSVGLCAGLGPPLQQLGGPA